MVFLALITNSFREAIQKKIILTIFVVISFLLILFLSFLNIQSVEDAFYYNSLTEGGLEEAILFFETGLIDKWSFLAVFLLLIMLVSSFIPSMLEKGNIDLIISKPISRFKIIIGKFISANIIVLTVLLYLIGVIWLMISVKTGIWHFTFLYSVIGFSLIFAILYSLILFIGLLTRSTILTIIINSLLFFPITIILAIRESIVDSLKLGKPIEFVLDFFYYVLPKPWGIHTMVLNLISGIPVESWIPLWTSLLFMLTMLTLSIYYFSKKDY